MSYQLTIEPLGQTITVEEGQTLLDASLRAGIYLPHACCHGLCATCKIQVLDGEIDHGEASNFALMDYEREEGMASSLLRHLAIGFDDRSRCRGRGRCTKSAGAGF